MIISLLKKAFIHISLKRYLIVGLFSTAITLTIIYSLKWTVNLSDVYANIFGYIVGLIFNFNVNKNWTFNYNNITQSIYFKFLLVSAIAYFANLTVVLICINNLYINSYISHALGVPAYTVLGYLGNRFFVFNNN